MPKRKPQPKSKPLTATVVPTTVECVFDRLRNLQWGLSRDKQEQLLSKMVGIVLSPEEGVGPDTRTRAFMAILEGQKLDLAAVKLLIDKAMIESIAQPRGSVIPLSQEALREIPVAVRVKMLTDMRNSQEPQHKVVG